MNISKFFIDRPIFAGVLSMLVFLAGAIALGKLPTAEYPEVVPPSVVVRAQYPGANPKVIAETVAAPLEEQINGVENMLYMQSQANSDGNMTTTVTFKLGTDPDKAQQLVQNRVSQAAAAPARGRAAARRDHRQELADADHGGEPGVAQRPLRPHLPAQLRADQRQGPARPGGRRRRGGDVGRRRLLDADLAGPHQGRIAQPDRHRRGQRDPRAERAGGRRHRRRRTDDHARAAAVERQRARAPEDRGGIRQHHRAQLARRRAHAPARRGARRAGRIRVRLARQPGRQARRATDHLPAAQRELAADLHRRAQDRRRAAEGHARGREGRDRLRPDPVRAREHRRSGPHAVRGDPAGGAGGDPVPADLARLDHPAAGRAGVDRRHLLADAGLRLLDQCALAVRPGAGDRHRGGRRDRGGGKRRAQHRRRLLAAGRLLRGDARGERADHRDRAGPGAPCSCRWPSCRASPASSTSSSR